MTDKEKALAKNKPAAKATPCESCMYYDYNEDDDVYECTMSLDEDEYLHFISRRSDGCPYYKFYDEYKTVQKQN